MVNRRSIQWSLLSLVLVVVLALTGGYLTHAETKEQPAAASGKPIHLTDAAFQKEVLESDKPVLVDFWAEWCGPCRTLAPTIEALASENAGKVKVGKVDVDAEKKMAAKYKVRAIPTVLLFHKGEVVKQFIGVQPKKTYQDALDAVVAPAK